ncbi:hypothetical protein GCM10009076_29230 [Erythrobacter ramosus]
MFDPSVICDPHRIAIHREEIGEARHFQRGFGEVGRGADHFRGRFAILRRTRRDSKAGGKGKSKRASNGIAHHGCHGSLSLHAWQGKERSAARAQYLPD